MLIAAVSYTHLDVYKRQEEFYPIHHAAPRFDELTTKTEIFETGIKAVDPVSYTHLLPCRVREKRITVPAA